MSEARHLLLSVPEEWSSDDKGDFYEEFVSEILRPMRFRPVQRLRVTGMEIDILAKGEDRPVTVLVECKAHRDPIAADVITKLMGNVQLRHADQGWLFSTSELTKDGAGLWEEIQADPANARTFVWYSPARTIEVLLSQRTVVDPQTLHFDLLGQDVGDWSLVVTPGHQSWLVELLEDGLPTRYSVFNARNGDPLNPAEAASIATASPRYAGLRLFPIPQQRAADTKQLTRAPVARVISGDAWEDPRPARPSDFVGRDDVLADIGAFIEQVRTGTTSTRSFAVLAPSGWGKSSLALKLAKQASTGALAKCSFTAVDSRSAATPAFVVEALRLALRDASAGPGTQKKSTLRVQSLREPLESPDVRKTIEVLRAHGRVAVLMFDQFEELFAKETLFEVFNAVRDLSLDIDAKQIPMILGFAWKTDVSLPQQHPAYHLWHQLADRRRTFKVAEFGRGEVARVVSKAEAAIGKRLSKALRSRLAEQCQGLPWLLKKLLVHVLQRVSTPGSQYLLLERELDIEQLFKEDLEQLHDDHLKCLRFVATRAPVPVADVEESFSRDTTNLLINQHLLVRSGMNYVVYWDIFRDYLVDDKVPAIPWARTFQRMPPVALKALAVLEVEGPLSAQALGSRLRLKEGPTFNVLGDLVALQLAESEVPGSYRVARHVTDLAPLTVAATVRGQLRRHVVAQAIERKWEKGEAVDYESWVAFFGNEQPRSRSYTQATLRQYAANLKGWLVFAGLLELGVHGVARADGNGLQMGRVAAGRAGGLFFGCAAPRRLEELLTRIFDAGGSLPRTVLEQSGYRNAIADGLALGLIDATKGFVASRLQAASAAALVAEGKSSVARQPAVELALKCLQAAHDDRRIASQAFAQTLRVSWKQASAARYLGGLARYAAWAKS